MGTSGIFTLVQVGIKIILKIDKIKPETGEVEVEIKRATPLEQPF
jgi:hypothetical protein